MEFDYYGYNVCFDFDNLNMIINNLYLRINFNGTYEKIIDSGMIIYDIYENGEKVGSINIDVGNLSSKDKEYIQRFNDNYINQHLR